LGRGGTRALCSHHPLIDGRIEVWILGADQVRRQVAHDGENIAIGRLWHERNLEEKIAAVDVPCHRLDIVALSNSLENGLGVFLGALLQSA